MVQAAGRVWRRQVKRGAQAWWEDAILALWLWVGALLLLLRREHGHS
jgi:hypothetical protein